MSYDLNEKATQSVKWSLLTEVLVKLISPITQLVLARILAPEAFGVVATVTMVTSFADMLSDSGFQNYLVQHDFDDAEKLRKSANVAFWTNLFISLFLWLLIGLFQDQLACLVGNPGLGPVLVIASLSLPLTAFASIQLALYRRSFDFKTLMPIRTIVALVPLVLTVPLALFGWGYWSLIIGTIVGNLVNAIALTMMSSWKPQLFYSIVLLKEMFSFSAWSLLEAIAIWLTSWAGTFVVGSLLNTYYLGLYKQPMTFVNSAFALVTNATTPVLFSSLSRLQDDRPEFRTFYSKFQFSVGMFVVPLGVGIFFFRNFLTDLLLGPEWTEASLMLGVWGFSTGLAIVFSHYCSEVYRSLGKPKVSLLSQCLYMFAMIPSLYFSANIGFQCLVVVNAAIRVVGIAINQVLLWRIAEISPTETFFRLRTPLVASSLMGVVAWCVSNAVGSSWLLNIGGIVFCAAAYVAFCLIFSDGRAFIRSLLRR